jgi:hypothetical protein
MGTTSVLSDTLFGRTRGAVLSILYGHVGEAFYLRQLARRVEIALGPVQREVRQLVDAGLVSRKMVGAQTLYSANQESPVSSFTRLCSKRPLTVSSAAANDTCATIKAFSKLTCAPRREPVLLTFKSCANQFELWLAKTLWTTPDRIVNPEWKRTTGDERC